MPSERDLFAGAVFAIGFVLLVGVAELWRRVGRANAEWTRKLVHFGGGIACLFLPALVDSHWVVLALAVFMSGVFWTGHATGKLESLHGVARKSRGAEYYPLVVYALFVLAHDRPWLYTIALLVLALADAAAGLIGSRYGRVRYEVEDEHKSVEGSLVFFVITFLAIEVPLVVWGDPSLPPARSCVLAASLTALLVTGFEAVSLGGRDNLWVPLGTYFVLSKILQQPFHEIVAQNVSMLAIALVVGAVASFTRAVNVGGAIVLLLWAYACWSLGSIDWALPVFLGIGVFVAMRVAIREPFAVKVRTVLRAILPTVVVLFAANASLAVGEASATDAGVDANRALDVPGWSQLYAFLYGPFLAGCVAVVIQIVWGRALATYRYRGARRRIGALVIGVCAALVLGAPAWRLQTGVPIASLVVLVVVGAACGVASDRLTRDVTSEEDARALPLDPRWVVTIGAIVAVGVLQLLESSPPWNPQ